MLYRCKTCSGYGYLLARGDYVTYEKFRDIIKQEPREIYRLLFKLVWYLGLKSQEVLRIRPIDINIPHSAERLAKYGIPPGTTDSIRIFRYTNDWRILPLPKWLKEEILDYASRLNIQSDGRIFARNRTTVFQRLNIYGNTIGEKRKIGVESLRKGFGIWYLAEGGHVEDLMLIYGHKEIQRTQSYLALDARRAILNFVEFQSSHPST